jgi:hypothetical protein
MRISAPLTLSSEMVVSTSSYAVHHRRYLEDDDLAAKIGAKAKVRAYCTYLA